MHLLHFQEFLCNVRAKKALKFFQYKKKSSIYYYITIIIFIYKILFFDCNIIKFNNILYDFYFIFYNLFHENIYIS